MDIWTITLQNIALVQNSPGFTIFTIWSISWPVMRLLMSLVMGMFMEMILGMVVRSVMGSIMKMVIG